MTWHVLTGEYPPDCGGVGDYTAALAHALADAGDTVHVWTPTAGGLDPAPRVHLHPLRCIRPGVARRRSTRSVLLQYVPRSARMAPRRSAAGFAPRPRDGRA